MTCGYFLICARTVVVDDMRALYESHSNIVPTFMCIAYDQAAFTACLKQVEQVNSTVAVAVMPATTQTDHGEQSPLFMTQANVSEPYRSGALAITEVTRSPPVYGIAMAESLGAKCHLEVGWIRWT